jgi:peptide/nickel transport system permease protein
MTEKQKRRQNESSITSRSQWQLIRLRFIRHKVAVMAFFVLQILYLIAVFAEFFAPYPVNQQNVENAYCPPQIPKYALGTGLYAKPLIPVTDPVTLGKSYRMEEEERVKISFFVKGFSYKLLGLIECHTHFVGAQEGQDARIYLLGTDKYGRDILSRIIYGARISLSVGIISIIVTFVIGVIVGGISGYIGGGVDNFIQRSIEVINAVPKLPLWLAFSAVLPDDWSALKIYFSITFLLSLLGWTNLARVVRGKLLSLREEDYAVAAYLLGASHRRIIFRHLLPGFASHIIVSLTMTVPWMILGETSLSFLGLGLRPPIVSWGVMLQDCMNMTTVANYPWLMLPVVFIILTVLCFNFMGDGLRDASDPYSVQ